VARRSTVRVCVAATLPAVLGLVLVLAGCGSSSYDYVTNKKAGTFLKVPKDWSNFRQLGPVFVGIDAKQLSPEAASALASREWVVGLDANTPPDQKRLLVADSGEPKGFVQVRELLPEEAEQLSTADLRNQIIDLTAAEQAQQQAVTKDPQAARIAPQFLLLSNEDVHKAAGIHGVHMVYQVRTEAGLATVDQTSLLDRDQTRLYQLIIACTARCYATKRGDVERVQSSFTIKPT
jgi:hypothetical protein